MVEGWVTVCWMLVMSVVACIYMAFGQGFAVAGW